MTVRGPSRAAPALVAAVAVVALLFVSDVGVGIVVRYAAYPALAVLGPGVLVSRALLGRPTSLVADLGAGGAVGMLLTLPAWWVAVALGWSAHLRWWPLLVYGAFAAVPAWRVHYRPVRYEQQLGPRLGWGLTLATLLAMVPFWGAYGLSQPLTERNQWHFDLHWQLGLVELFVRQVRPEDSQVAGEPLAYHWFADADMAAASLVSGVDPAVVISRIWALPLVLLTFAMLVAVLSDLTRHGRRAGVLASVLVAAPVGLEVLPWVDVPWDPVFAPLSPSQVYSYPLLLLLLLLLARALRGRSTRRELVLLAALLLLSPGIKASTLPVVLSGLLLTTVVAVLRRAPWQRPAALSAVAAGALLAGTVLIGAGGAAGSGIQLFSTLDRLPAYYRSVGMEPLETRLSSGLLPADLEVPGAWALLLLLFLATVLKHVWVLPGAVLLRGRGTSFDPVPWLLAGGGLAGFLLLMLIDQDGLSQAYFMLTGTVLWAMLAAWGLVALLARSTAAHGRVATTRRAVAGGGVGVLVAVVSAVVADAVAHRTFPPPGTPPPGDVPDPQVMARALATGLVPVVVALLAAAVWLALGSRGKATGPSRAVPVATALVVAGLALNPWLSRPSPPRPLTSSAVTPVEVDAARWVDEHAGAHDVVATNVHCLGSSQRRGCDARAFWVSSLTRRRTYVGGWAYLDQTRANAAGSEVPQSRQPFPDQGRLDLNEALFAEPTTDVVAQLAGAGVRWVYADHRRGPVSPVLADVAELVLSTEDVDVYRLPAGG